MAIAMCVGKKLMIPRDVRPPFKRVLSDHAQNSYNHAVRMEWLDHSQTPAPVEYGSPLKDNVLFITTTTICSGDDDAGTRNSTTTTSNESHMDTRNSTTDTRNKDDADMP